jgi:hypothetical protein
MFKTILGTAKQISTKHTLLQKSHHSKPDVNLKIGIYYDNANIIKHTRTAKLCDSAWHRWDPILIAPIPVRSAHHPGPDDFDLWQHI